MLPFTATTLQAHTTESSPKESRSSASRETTVASAASPAAEFSLPGPQGARQESFQLMADNSATVQRAAEFQAMADQFTGRQAPPNRNGLPTQLKSGIERLSGFSMDDVRVHYNSAKPAQLQAKAFAQGSEIHLGSGQEKHLPHEAWHVVQQKQGRVRPTLQLKGKVAINDDQGLEREADIMGAKANSVGPATGIPLIAQRVSAGPLQLKSFPLSSGVIQLCGCWDAIKRMIFGGGGGGDNAQHQQRRPQRVYTQLGQEEDDVELGQVDRDQDDFVGDVTGRLQDELGPGDLAQDTCSTCATTVYEHLARATDASGEGIRSLTRTMTQQMRSQDVVVFKVNLDAIIGHQFTIIQRGSRASIIQGYLNKQTLGKNLEAGSATQGRSVAGIIDALLEIDQLWGILTTKKNKDIDSDELNRLVQLKMGLFGIEISRRDKVLMLNKMNGMNKGKALTWYLGRV